MAVNQCQPTHLRPSLYATLRLARLVLGFKERLKSKIKIRQSLATAVDVLQTKSFKALDFENINQAFRSHDESRATAARDREYGNFSSLDLGATVLLNDLDSHAKPGQLPLSTIAAHDQLFLEHNIHHFASFNSSDIKHTLDVTTLVLERLRQRQRSYDEEPHENLDFAKYSANLEHLLLCLQQAALAALIHLSLKLIEAEALRWINFRRRLVQVIEGWFAEWPGGRHPLSTTWPWTIKSSLVILWGVCWKFHTGDNAQMWMPNGTAQSGQFSENSRPWSALPAQSAVPSQQNPATWTASGFNTPSVSIYSPSQWLRPATSDTRLSRRANNRNSDYQSALPGSFDASVLGNPYIFSPTASSDRLPDPLTSQPHFQGSNYFPTSCPDYTFEGDWPLISPLEAHIAVVEATAPGCQIEHTRPNVPGDRQAISFLESTRNVSHQFGLQLPGTDMQGYPSPGSEYSKERNLSCSPLSPPIAVGSNMPLAASTSTSPQPRQEESRKSREPTKNAEGFIYCAHPKCGDQPPIFARKCEWTKHMDKHDRPYVCEEPGCEKIQGFTYSGGLLRHQREVHRHHGGPKATFMCPYRDCKRSTGVGFSRKENLSEHLRRVHRGAGEQDKTSAANVQHQDIDQKTVTPITLDSRKRTKGSDFPEDERGVLPEALKRRRGQDRDVLGHSENVGQPQDLQQQVEALTRELRVCQDKIRKLEQTVEQISRDNTFTYKPL